MAYNETMKFSPYEYREYPKWIETGTNANGKPAGVIVYDEDEEAQVSKTKAAPVRSDDERARLILVAEINNVTVDKRWSIDRLSKAISEAGFDPDHNPYE